MNKGNNKQASKQANMFQKSKPRKWSKVLSIYERAKNFLKLKSGWKVFPIIAL